MSRVLDPACGPGPMNRAHELWPGTRPGMVQVPGTPEFPMSPPQQMRPGKTDTPQASPQIDDTQFHFENSCRPCVPTPCGLPPILEYINILIYIYIYIYRDKANYIWL